MKRHTVFLLIAVLLALMLASVGGAAAEPAAPYAYSFPIPGEPNDAFATANDAYGGYLMTPTDVDFFRLELEEDTWLMASVNIQNDWATPPRLRVQLAIFDSSQTLLAEDADCDEDILIPPLEVPAGLNYIRVRACSGYFDSDQSYGVPVRTFETFESEPNDSFASAMLVDLGDTTIGLSSSQADLDYYRLELPSATLLTYSAQHHSWTSNWKGKLALYDATHTLLAEDADCNYSAELETSVGPGTYFLSVQPCAGTPANSDLYGLNVYGKPLEAEPNDTFATATPQVLGGYYDSYALGFLPTQADRDYYRFEVLAPLRFSPSAYFVDLTLALYDAAYTELVRGDISLYLFPGTYYLVAEPKAGTATDEAYKLNFFWRPYEIEPNDNRATATGMYDDDILAGAIQPAGDVDFYRFEGQAKTRLHAYVSASGGPMVPEIALLAADGTVLASRSEPDCLFYCTPDFDYDFTADATYYLRVRSVDLPARIGDYSVGIRVTHEWASDMEPNDTPDQAVPIAYGDHVYGYIEGSDVVDTYRFTGQAGDEMVLAFPSDHAGTGASMALYDPSLNPVLLNEDYHSGLWATLPVTGTYTLSFTNTGHYGDDYYDFILMRTTGDEEPNNTMATATDVVFGPTLTITYDYLCDTDWFRFQGRAGDVLADVNGVTYGESEFLYDVNGNHLPGHVLPADGTYYLEAAGYWSTLDDFGCYEGVYTIPFGEALWVSAAVNGLGGSAAIKSGDIVTRKNGANQWQIVFDASDVGITANVAAFERMPNGSILMSLGKAQNLPGLGKVTTQDIIRFAPTALGDTTAGTFLWFLDGSDVGLSTAGEKIDAISMQRDVQQPLRISITGAGSVPRQSGGALKVADEDVINFVGTAYGADSIGNWRVNLDGSTVPGMATEDVSSMTRVEVYPQRDSQTLLSFDSAFKISGQSGGPFDVWYEGTWRPAIVRLTDKKIDGLSVGPAYIP